MCVCVYAHRRVMEQDSLIAHDYNEVRAVALRNLSEPHGECHRAEEAVEVRRSRCGVGVG